jgi:AcrR family transcriptional regulator
MTARERGPARRTPGDRVSPDPVEAVVVTDRREQILQTAQKLFAEKGFRGTSLNDVANRLGFRQQAVYHYFRSKEEILYELIDRAGQAIATSAQLTMDTDTPPADKLAEIVRNHVRQLLNNIDIFRIQFSELFKLRGDRADGLRRDMLDYVRDVADVIEAGQRAGTFVEVPPTTQALLILGMCNGITDWYGSAQPTLSVEEIADDAARMALSGVTRRDRRDTKLIRRR